MCRNRYDVIERYKNRFGLYLYGNLNGRKLSTPPVGDTDMEDSEMKVEGQAVVHLDASILHRIKQEPTDNDEYHQPTCVFFQQMKEIEKSPTTDECDFRPITEHDTQNTDKATDPPLNEESLDEDCYGDQTVSNQENPAVLSTADLRRSTRQHISKRRLSAEHKEKESDSYQRRKVTARMHPGNSPRNAPSVVIRRTKETFPSASFEQDASRIVGTNVVISDSSEVFRRRFRKMLKELVAKRMLKLQHTAVYSETVTALQRKIAILERRNGELEEKAARLETSIINLSSERENGKTETVSRGTQVSMGMIMSRVWPTSGRADKPASVSIDEQTSLPSFSDGPVIVNVFGNQGNNGPSDVQPPQMSAKVPSDNPQETLSASPVSQAPQANLLYPKIQHVSSIHSSKPGSFNQHSSVPTCETFILPEHRFQGHGLHNRLTSCQTITSLLQATNVRMPRPENSPLPSSAQATLMGSHQGLIPGYAPTRIQQNYSESVHRIATVRPQQINPSLGTAAQCPTQQMPQVTHNPHHQPALGSGPLLRSTEGNVSQLAKSKEDQHEEVQSRRQGPVAVEQQDKNRPKDSELLVNSNSPTNNVPSRYHKRGLHELPPDSCPNVQRSNYISSWGETASGLGRSSTDSVSQGIPESNKEPSSSSCNVIANGRSSDLVLSRGHQQRSRKSNGDVRASAYASKTGERIQGFLSHTQTSPHTFVQQRCVPAALLSSDNSQLYRLTGPSANANSPLDPVAQQSVDGSVALTGLARPGQLSSGQSGNSIPVSTQNVQYRQPSQLPTANGSSLPQPNQVEIHTSSTPGDSSIIRQFPARELEYERLSGQNIRPQMGFFWHSRFNQRQPYNGPNGQMVPFGSDGRFRGYHQYHQWQQREHFLSQQQQNQQQQWHNIQRSQLQQHRQQKQQNQQLQQQRQFQLHQQQQNQRQQQQQQQQQHQQCQQQQRQQQIQLQQHQPYQRQQQQHQQPQQQLQLQQQQIQLQQHQQYQLQQQHQHQPQQQLPPYLMHYQQKAVCLQPPKAPNQVIPPGINPPSHQQMMPHWQHGAQIRVSNAFPQGTFLSGQSTPFQNVSHTKASLFVQTDTQAPLSQTLRTITSSEGFFSARDGTYIHHENQSHNSQNQNIVPRREIYAVQQQVKCGERDASELLSNGSQSLRTTASQSGPANVDPPRSNETTQAGAMTTTCADISCNSSTISTLNTMHKSSGSDLFVPLPPSFDGNNKAPSRHDTVPSDAGSLTPSNCQKHDITSTSTFSSDALVSPLRCDDKMPYSAPSVKPTLEKAQESSMKNNNETFSTNSKDTVGLTVSHTSPSQPEEANKPSEKPNTTGSSATDSATEVEDESDETNSTALNGEDSQGSSPDDRRQEESETPNQPSDQDEASHLETNEPPLSLKPVLTFEQSDKDIVLLWDLPDRGDETKVIKYELFVMSAPAETNLSNHWDLLGALDALALPMACTVNQFMPGAAYYFTVRAVTENYHCGLFSDPCLVTIKEPE